MRVALNGLFLGRTDGTGRYTHGLLSASAGLDGPELACCWRWPAGTRATGRGRAG